MTEMSNKEIKRFLMKDTFTGKLATVKEDGSPHVVPIWFVLDDDTNNKKMLCDILLLLETRQSRQKISNAIIE